MLPLIVLGGVGVGLWWWLGADTGPQRRWRETLRTGAPDQQRATLRAIAAARDGSLLPDVTRVWERVYQAENFQRTHVRPGSLQPELHAVFETLGPAAAEQLVEWAAQTPTRFTPCLIAAGVALGGQHSAEVGAAPTVGGIRVRTYFFTVGTHRLEIPTYMDSDWYGQLEKIREWRAYLSTLR